MSMTCFTRSRGAQFQHMNYFFKVNSYLVNYKSLSLYVQIESNFNFKWRVVLFEVSGKILTRSFASTMRSKTMAAKLTRQVTNTQLTC